MTHVLDPLQFYGYPPGFGFEGDSKTWVTPSNVQQRATEFAAFIKKKAAGYFTNSLLVPFGSDCKCSRSLCVFFREPQRKRLHSPVHQGQHQL